jgi:transcriptional regulator with PAS, ATPase and Fis domain
VPGVLVIFEAGRAVARPIAVPPEGVTFGRGVPDGLLSDDDQVSRAHARVECEAAGFSFTDLDSRNGSFVDGAQLERAVLRPGPTVLRVGRSVLWAVPDVRPFALGAGMRRGAGADAPVLGGLLNRAFGEIALAAKSGDTLLIQGESGAGKELAARAFHEAHFGSGTSAPLIAVNCAAIPEGLAERLLFGAKRGAYSGAVDADGYLQQADGGTLFLDEIAELDPLVQAKLLRVLETREVLALGAGKPRPVTIRICAATHKNLRDEVSAGRFRADLYYRIGRPEVRVPPLRERIDEIPWHAQRVLAEIDATLAASATLIEACALRPWPGNVRELLHELRRAAHAAQAEGVQLVQPQHLAADAGTAIALSAERAAQTGGDVVRATDVEDAAIERALAEHAGNVTAAARALGLHRNQLRRWLARHGQPGPE